MRDPIALIKYIAHPGCLSFYVIFVCISQDLIVEVPSRDVSKEKLDLNSRKLSHIQN